MKQLFDAKKAARHRQFHWCRRPNSFSDQPIWRLVASKCNMPLYQVLAFVNRLEEHANNAANHGLIRGSLHLFDADEFGVALGMSAEEAARLYAALEDPKIAWIADDHIASFCDRNPDREEDIDDARRRKRRQRSRERVLKQLAKLARDGRVDAAERLTIEVALRGISDEQLQFVQDQLARAELSTGHKVTARDIVTVTPEQSRNLEKSRPAAVDNSGDRDREKTSGLAEAEGGEAGEALEQATSWLDSQGVALLVNALTIRTQVATTYIERWRRDVQDDHALAAIMRGAEARGLQGARLHVTIADGVQRFLRERANGPVLAMGPVRPGSQPKGPETALGHNVTSGPVEITGLKRSAS